jgi:hypothetical protein
VGRRISATSPARASLATATGLHAALVSPRRPARPHSAARGLASGYQALGVGLVGHEIEFGHQGTRMVSTASSWTPGGPSNG